MATQQYLAELEEHWARVELARETFFKHFFSDAVSKKHNLSPSGRDEEEEEEEMDITAKTTRIHATRTNLQARLAALFTFSLSSAPTLEPWPTLLHAFLHQIPTLALETAPTYLHRLLTAILSHLQGLNLLISTLESAILDRFDDITTHHATLETMLRVIGTRLDNIADVNEYIHDQLHNLRAQAQNSPQCRMTRGKIAILRKRGREAQDSRRLLEAALERQMLQWKYNISLVGVRVARQRLITEFFFSDAAEAFVEV